MNTPLHLIRFSARWCAHCKAQRASRVVEQFIKSHPSVDLLEADVPSQDGGDTPADLVADAYAVEGLPTILFEGEDGAEYARHEGEISPIQLVNLYREAESRQTRGKPIRQRRGYAAITEKHAKKREA